MDSVIDALHAYRDGTHVGMFVRRGEQIHFEYDSPATATPISLSLPPDGQHRKRAAANWLENLLPDNGRVREMWARTLGVQNTGFDLLKHLGEDVTGALTLVPDARAATGDFFGAGQVFEDELAHRIGLLRTDPDAWNDADTLPSRRASIAGAQAKFTLAHQDGRWVWPSAAAPSTHIWKPPFARFSEAAVIEVASLRLAAVVGLAAPHAEVRSPGGQESYVVERFDREQTESAVHRRHIEDFVQALGLPPAHKYGVPVRDIFQLLLEHADVEEAYRFLKQFAFNTMLGNADAHAKNYSIFLEDVPRLTPIYDTLPTLLWPFLDGRLAMRVGGASHSNEAAANHWRRLATKTGLDPQRVLDIVRHLASQMHEHVRDVFLEAGVPGDTAERVTAIVVRTTSNLLRTV